jgi:hypothetical protein
MFICLSVVGEDVNCMHFRRPNISEKANDLLYMTDKMETFY